MIRSFSVFFGMAMLFVGCGDDGSNFFGSHSDVRQLDASVGDALPMSPSLPTSPRGAGGGEQSPRTESGGAESSRGGASGAATWDAGAPDADAADAAAPSTGAAPAVFDAGMPAPDAAPPCTTRLVWYADDDHDGFGDRARLVVACMKPANGSWVPNSDDCDDADARVHPGQTAYFGAPYTAPSGDDSFDYDCSGTEDADPSLAPAPADCSLLAIGSCGGSGYLPTSRAGAGTAPWCGSVQTLTCSVDTLVLCAPTKAVTGKAFGCR